MRVVTAVLRQVWVLEKGRLVMESLRTMRSSSATYICTLGGDVCGLSILKLQLCPRWQICLIRWLGHVQLHRSYFKGSA